jgi:integrase
VKYELAILRRALSLAVKQGRLASWPAFPTIRVDNARSGFFEAAELEAVVAELPEPLRNVARFAYHTGWRSAEIRGLTMADVDWTAKTVRLPGERSKNEEARVFPFGALPALADAMEQQRNYTDAVQRRTGQIVPWLFHREGKPIRSMYDAWRAACERAKVSGRLMHDFRRTAVRNLERAGVPRSVAMKLTGHKTEAIYQRYAIVAERDLAEGVAKLAALAPAPRTVIPFPVAAG